MRPGSVLQRAHGRVPHADLTPLFALCDGQQPTVASTENLRQVHLTGYGVAIVGLLSRVCSRVF